MAAPDVAAFWDARAKRYTTDAAGRARTAAAAAGARVRRDAARPARRRAAAAQAPQGPRAGGPGQRGPSFATVRADFLRAEGALGTLTDRAIGHGLYQISGNRSADPATTLPAVSIAAEHYDRIARMLAKKIPVTIEADIKNTFYPNPPVFNVVGEIHGHRQGGRGRAARRPHRHVALGRPARPTTASAWRR